MDKHFASDSGGHHRVSPDLADVRLVSVTLDPDFDTPRRPQKHAKAAGADPASSGRSVTGDRDDVLALAKRFGVTRPSRASRPDVVVHNLRTAVIDAEGRLVSVHSGNMWTPAELVADLKKAPAPAN